MEYTTGDALGVVPRNCPRLVSDLLGVLGCGGHEEVEDADGDVAGVDVDHLQLPVDGLTDHPLKDLLHLLPQDVLGPVLRHDGGGGGDGEGDE